MSKKYLAAGVVASLTFGTLTFLATEADASGPNKSWNWETKAGARHHGRTEIKASYNDSGRHAKQGYHRFTRDAGPSLDTGRKYTPKASSRKDTRTHGVKTSVWDSPLWGDKYTTKFNYNYRWF